MRHLGPLLFASIAIGLIGACEPKKVEETVWDDQIKTMDKAREVEETLMNRAEQMGKELDPNYKPEDDEEDPQH
ncbi:MAG: hypothetical protein OEQ74_00880 [Gammaproteobacteria bacterium]|nr:hypothetical protein [Gammaproteobacteria bacterium]